MRISVTAHPPPEPHGSASGDLVPELALPWVVKLRYGMASGQLAAVVLAHFILGIPLPVGLLLVPIFARRWTCILGTLSTLGFALLFRVHRPLPALESANMPAAQPSA